MADEKEKKERKESRIIITFLGGIGSAIMDIKFENVAPTQAAAAAWLLDKQAQNAFFQHEMEKQQSEQVNKILVPNQGLTKAVVREKT